MAARTSRRPALWAPRSLPSLVGGVLVAGLLGATPAGPASAATAAPSWAAEMHPAAEIVDPWDIAQAGGVVFVSDGDVVHAFERGGARITSITGVSGARDLAPSADGTLLLVARPGANAISVIDPRLRAVTATYAVADCPTNLAASGSLVFYSYGCGNDGAINHIDLATGTVHPLGSPDVPTLGLAAGVPRLGAGGGSLYATDAQGMLHGWPVTGTGVGAERAIYLGSPGAPPFEVRGTTLALAGMAGVRIVDGPSLVTRGTVGTQGFTTLGMSPDGSRVAAGAMSDPVEVHDPVLGSHRGTVLLPGTAAPYYGVAGSVVFSADGALMYWLVYTSINGPREYALVVGSASLPPKLPLALSIAQPSSYLGWLTFVITGAPNRPATLLITDPAGRVSRYPVVTGADGRAVVRLQRLYNGKAVVDMPGDATHRAARTSSVPFRLAVRIRATPSDPYRIVSGVLYYARATSAKQFVLLGPARPGRVIRGTLWRWTGKTWAMVESHVFPLSSTGRMSTVMASAVRGVRYRITFSFAGDAYNTAAKTTTAPFVIG